VFPALPSVVVRSARQRKFFLKNKNIFADPEQATTLGKGFFSKMEIIFADGRTQALGTYFLRKIKNPPLCRRLFFWSTAGSRLSAKAVPRA
jgi:hypothetical protein